MYGTICSKKAVLNQGGNERMKTVNILITFNTKTNKVHNYLIHLESKIWLQSYFRNLSRYPLR